MSYFWNLNPSQWVTQLCLRFCWLHIRRAYQVLQSISIKFMTRDSARRIRFSTHLISARDESICHATWKQISKEAFGVGANTNTGTFDYMLAIYTFLLTRALLTAHPDGVAKKFQIWCQVLCERKNAYGVPKFYSSRPLVPWHQRPKG